ncbi:MAG TPA: VOC family protein, partial [Gaiellaceae bacterium]|nr:VOC family protein [Gaiellaceae bacterium]
MSLDLTWVDPPFDIVRVAHVELTVTDLAASRAFYVDVLGLVPTAETDDALYLRGYEERLHHSLVLRRGPQPLLDHIAYRVRRPEDLDGVADAYRALGCDVARVEGVELGQGPAIRLHDPLGFPLEFFHEMDQAEC